MDSTYASSPKIVGGREDEGHSPPQCPVEETRCPVVAHDWVNDEYKHLVVKATPKAGSVADGLRFSLLSRGREQASYMARQGSAIFERIVPGDYQLAVAESGNCLGTIELTIKEGSRE